MKIDFFVGILMVFVGLLIISWVAQPDFALKNPGAANFLGFTGSTVKTSNTATSTNPVRVNTISQNSGRQGIKIIGASISFEEAYNQIVLYVDKSSARINLSGYILKTTSGSYNLPAVSLGAGDYALLTSNTSPDGLVARRISPNHYEVFLGQRFLSSRYETAELYNSAGNLVSKYTYGLTSFLQD